MNSQPKPETMKLKITEGEWIQEWNEKTYPSTIIKRRSRVFALQMLALKDGNICNVFKAQKLLNDLDKLLTQKLYSFNQNKIT